jgi:hemerythrin-like domain-containing protein
MVSEMSDFPITAILLIEHRLLRELMSAMNNWQVGDVTAEALRERAAVLAVALDVHAKREEDELFALLRARSEGARHLVDMMELVHDEVHSLFEEVEAASDPKARLWTILEMTEAHFVREEQEVFPLAETLLEPAELARRDIV